MSIIEFLVLGFLVSGCTAENLTKICLDEGFDNVETRHFINLTATSDTLTLIQENGYPIETYEVQTTDGYILDLYRIPHGLTKENNNKGLVLILQGIPTSTTLFVYQRSSLAYYLANRGYDVWLGNLRGNFQNSRHIRYNQDDQEFWDFGFDEIIDHDTPAIIDYVLEATNRSRLSIISYSATTITVPALFVLKPEYNNKVSRHVAIAPVISFDYRMGLPIDTIMTLYTAIKKLFGVPNDFLFKLHKSIYETAPIDYSLQPFYGYWIAPFAGYSPGSYGRCSGLIAAYVSQGTSTKLVEHYLQFITKRELTRFDYGPEENKDVYGSETPPVIDMSQTTVPTALIYNANDPRANALNVAVAVKKMKTAKAVLLEGRMSNHVDYFMSLDVDVLNRFNQKILENLD